MKKLLFILISFFIISTGFAQFKGFTLGPKIGANFSKISENADSLKNNMQPGFEVGAFVRIGKKIYIQPEVMFKTKGGKFDYEGGSNAKYQVKLQTLDVPLMVGARLIDLKVVNIRIMLGPVASFVLNKDIDTENTKDEIIESKDFKDMNWGFQAGAGIDVLFLTLDVRYELGLNNMYDGKIDKNDVDFKNNLWSVSLGYKLF